MLGISYLELLFLLGLGSVILGPKDLPRVARYAGQATGRAASFLTVARSRFTKFSEEAHLDKLHAEMQQSMQQLSAIQSELRGNINFMNPGPVARRAMKMPAAQATSAQASHAYEHSHQQSSQDQGKTNSSKMASSPAASSFAASAIEMTATMNKKLAHTSELLQQQTAQKSDGQLTALPLSAVAMGKAPGRSGSIPTGSDILLDALREEEVAAQAQQFLETDQGQALLRQEPVKD